jgi:dihydroorotate dehydrogenase
MFRPAPEPIAARLFQRTWPVARSALFRMDAESAHEQTLALLGRAPRTLGHLVSPFTGGVPRGEGRDLFGLRFRGPIGLAAGLDKDARALEFWPHLGFGFVEVGTVTSHAQPGNPKPRLHRLVSERAIINRMGFNNEGSAALARRLGALKGAGRWPTVPVGVNVGKSKVTPLDEAPQDYATSIQRLRGLADYFTINVSSPNTPGLRELQGQEHLVRLLAPSVEAAHGTPVLLKLAPDLAPNDVQDAVRLAIDHGIQGIIASNTTIRRDVLPADPNLQGGLSGRPLRPLAKECIQVALGAADGVIPVIGVGGVESPDDVRELLTMGCAAVQLYSALIYEGPGLPGRLHRATARAWVA